MRNSGKTDVVALAASNTSLSIKSIVPLSNFPSIVSCSDTPLLHDAMRLSGVNAILGVVPAGALHAYEGVLPTGYAPGEHPHGCDVPFLVVTTTFALALRQPKS